jgi:hypothetical protein
MEEIPKQLANQLPADTFFVQYKSRRHSWKHILPPGAEIKSDIIILLPRQTNLFRN